MLYQSYEDVRLAKAQLDAQVQQTAQSYATALGQTIDYSGGPTTYTVVQLEALVQADVSGDTAAKLKSDFIAFYTAWNSFYTTGTDQTSTLWFPNFPDNAEYETLVQFQTSLAALQTRISALYSSASVTPITPSSTVNWSPFALYPMLAPTANATLTSATYVALALAAFFYLGPLALDVGEAWSPSPRTPPRRK
jgi:hypothetical protein